MVKAILTPDHHARKDEIKARPWIHQEPRRFSDLFALGFTELLRFAADIVVERYGHRAVILETASAVPDMVGAKIELIVCLRRKKDDDDWVPALLAGLAY